MGREIKRVALDFDYPINKMIWKGYHNPYHPLECGVCSGSGMSPEAKRVCDDWYGFDDPTRRWCDKITQDEVQALLDAGRLWDFTRVPITLEQKREVVAKIAAGENGWLPYDNGCVPTAEEVNEWSRRGLGHDAINQSICVDARLKRLGIERECPCCKGEGVLWPAEEYARLAEAFVPVEPPAGEGWQLWSTTTEGTPMSPVFETPEKLAQWLVDTKASTFGTDTATYEEWLRFINRPSGAPSLVVRYK